MTTRDDPLLEDEPGGEGGGGLSLPAFARDPIGLLRRRWPWMGVVLVGFGALALTAAALFPLSYRASTQVLLTGKRIPEEFVRSTIREGAAYPCPLEFSKGTQRMIDMVLEAEGRG